MSGEDRRSLGVGWVALGLFFLSGCTTVAQVTTWSDESCRQKVKGQLQSILTDEGEQGDIANRLAVNTTCLLYTSPSPRDRTRSRMPSSA